MLAVEHHLHAVRPSAQIAVGQMTEVLSDPLRRNDAILRRARMPRALRQRRETRQALHRIASSNTLHTCENPVIQLTLLLIRIREEAVIAIGVHNPNFETED